MQYNISEFVHALTAHKKIKFVRGIDKYSIRLINPRKLIFESKYEDKYGDFYYVCPNRRGWTRRFYFSDSHKNIRRGLNDMLYEYEKVAAIISQLPQPIAEEMLEHFPGCDNKIIFRMLTAYYFESPALGDDFARNNYIRQTNARVSARKIIVSDWPSH